MVKRLSGTSLDFSHGKDYAWHKINIFTKWSVSTRKTAFLIFDAPPGLIDKLQNALGNFMTSNTCRDAFWFYVPLVEEFIRLQDESVWAIRNRVRGIEQQQVAQPPKPDYRRRHDAARHAVHISETLEVAGRIMRDVISQHQEFIADYLELSDARTKHAARGIHKRLVAQRTMIECLGQRSASNKDRLLNELNLNFHTVAQYDSAVAVQIGRAAQEDSSAMKTVAFLTLTFLPATFVSAILGMSFFNYDADSDKLSVSSQFWVYWAVVIPLTLATFILWNFWRRLFPPRLIGDVGQSVLQRQKNWHGQRGDV